MDSETAPTRPMEAMRARETEKVFIVKGVLLVEKKKMIKTPQGRKKKSNSAARRKMRMTLRYRRKTRAEKIQKKGFSGGGSEVKKGPGGGSCSARGPTWLVRADGSIGRVGGV